MSWIDDLVTLLTDAGVGQLNVDLFTTSASEPPILPSGEATLTLVQTGGTATERTQNRIVKPAYIKPSAIVISRARNATKAKDKAQAAWNALVGIRNCVVTDYVHSGWYREINPLQSEPVDVGKDSRQQSRFTFNVMGVRRP